MSFDKRIKNVHELSSRLGVHYLYAKSEQDYGLGFNSAIDELVSVGNEGISALRRRLVALRANQTGSALIFNTDYTFLDKYFISFNVAMDGSSHFSGKNIPRALTISGNKYAVLPSIAGASLTVL